MIRRSKDCKPPNSIPEPGTTYHLNIADHVSAIVIGLCQSSGSAQHKHTLERVHSNNYLIFLLWCIFQMLHC